MIKKFIPLIFLLTPLLALAASKPISVEQLSELRSLLNVAKERSNEADRMRKDIEKLSAEIAAINRSKSSINSEITRASEELEKKENFERENPGSLSPEALAMSKSNYNAVVKRRNDAQVKLNRANQTINEINSNLSGIEVEESHAKTAYQARFEQIANQVVNERVNSYKTPTVVTESATVACDSYTVSECKLRAKKEAERKAVEQGSVIVVDSITEISNLKLTKDQTRSEVRGIISQSQVVEQRLVNDDTAAFAKIKATITPGIGDSLYEEIKQSVWGDISAVVGDSKLATRATKSVGFQPVAPESPVEVKRSAPAYVQPVEEPRRQTYTPPPPPPKPNKPAQVIFTPMGM